MTLTLLTEHWPGICKLLKNYLPDAEKLPCPLGATDLSQIICDLAHVSELTIEEAAELLDDLALSYLANCHHTSEVTHKMVASS